jgi:hypothetical protein
VSDSCLTWEIVQIHAVTSCIPRYHDNSCLALDQHALLDLINQIVLT